ncbi:MAG: alpha/beta fold hydrolase [Chloroflexi bacterium]|nr:alpha/beta fold hydrolase [Chloroflexota bacterium]MCO6445286.1 alpha/beta fold hydrolase [Anaerolineae bacterium]
MSRVLLTALRFVLLILFGLILSSANAQSVDAPREGGGVNAVDYALLEPYTLEALRAREYPGGAITIERAIMATDTFTRYLISYPSDGLTITGIMQIPPGVGPFPVIVLNHGFIRQSEYWSGYETWEAAGYLNARGYLTVSSDYRSWGGSDWGISLFHTGLTADVLNLISALASVPQADTSRIGMWGHSMGGGITTKALTIDPRIDAAVLYATNSADDSDLIGQWGPGCLAERRAGRRCNRGEIIPAGVDETLFETYLDAAGDPEFIARVSPIHDLDRITVPVQIHIGDQDTVVPPAWSTKLYDAMRAEDVAVELFWYEGQDHTFWGDSWVEFMQRVTAFFDLYVKNAAMG